MLRCAWARLVSETERLCVAPDVEGVEGVTAFLREVVKRGGRVVSVHFALGMGGLRLIAQDPQHRVLLYGAA